MKKAFSLVELLIVVAIIGILAAIVVPIFNDNLTRARESAAKDTLHVVRSAIEVYAAKHKGIAPGYMGDNTKFSAHETIFYVSMLTGHYISTRPKNQFNNLTTIQIIGNNSPMPEAATGQYGWIYKPATKDFRIDWPGTDRDGTRYYDY